MKFGALLTIIMVIASPMTHSARAVTTLYTTHPQVAHVLEQMSSLYSQEKSLPPFRAENLFTAQVNIHDFEPTAKDLRKLHGKDHLFAGPLTHQAWIRQAEKAGLLSPKAALIDIFKSSHDHFWLIPSAACAFEKFVFQALHQWALLKEEVSFKKDLYCKWTQEQADRLELGLKEKGVSRIILTHNSLSPLLKRGDSFEVLVLQDHSHHHESSPQILKKAYRWLSQAKGLLVIKEVGFTFPKALNTKASKTILWRPLNGERPPLYDLIQKVKDL